MATSTPASVSTAESDAAVGGPAAAIAAATRRAAAPDNPWRQAWRRLRRNRPAVAGGVVLLLIALVGLLGPMLLTIDPYRQNLRESLMPPGTDGHLLGTDHLGRDILLRLIDGARVSLSVGLIAVAISVLLGGGMGLAAGYFGGWPDRILMRVIDAQLAFPGILLALVIVTVLGTGLDKAMIAVGIGGMPRYARVVRASVLATKHEQFVEAAISLGASHPRLMFGHILPHVLGPLLTLATLGMGTAILAAASLAFLGLGPRPPTAEWGLMLAEGRKYIRIAWWLAAFPGTAIMLTVLAINLLGDGVRDALDPRLTTT
jgi:peptide/nickel transport system permease protein